MKKIRSLDEDQTPAERRAAMTWAQRLKRVFAIDIETCSECGGDVRIIACIEDPEVIRKILAHLTEKREKLTQKTASVQVSFMAKGFYPS